MLQFCSLRCFSDNKAGDSNVAPDPATYTPKVFMLNVQKMNAMSVECANDSLQITYNVIYSTFLKQDKLKSQTFWIIVDRFKPKETIVEEISEYFYSSQISKESENYAQNSVKSNHNMTVDSRVVETPVNRSASTDNLANNGGLTPNSNIISNAQQQFAPTSNGIQKYKNEEYKAFSPKSLNSSQIDNKSNYISKMTIKNDNDIPNKLICGLENIGNSCYMNAALQVFCRTPKIRDYFLENQYYKCVFI